MLARFDLSNGPFGEAGVIACGEVLGRLDYIDQMMRHSAALGLRDFGCCDVDSAIDLNGIEVDDLAFARQSELDAQVTFAGSGGSDDYGNQCFDRSCRWHQLLRTRESVAITGEPTASA